LDLGEQHTAPDKGADNDNGSSNYDTWDADNIYIYIYIYEGEVQTKNLLKRRENNTIWITSDWSMMIDSLSKFIKEKRFGLFLKKKN